MKKMTKKGVKSTFKSEISHILGSTANVIIKNSKKGFLDQYCKNKYSKKNVSKQYF